jgi:hypothetical protein
VEVCQGSRDALDLHVSFGNPRREGAPNLEGDAVRDRQPFRDLVGMLLEHFAKDRIAPPQWKLPHFAREGQAVPCRIPLDRTPQSALHFRNIIGTMSKAGKGCLQAMLGLLA